MSFAVRDDREQDRVDTLRSTEQADRGGGMDIDRSSSGTRSRTGRGASVVMLTAVLALTAACSSSSKGASGTTIEAPVVTDASGAVVTTVAGAAAVTVTGDYDKVAFCAAAKQINALDTAMSSADNQASLQDNYDKRIVALRTLAGVVPKELKSNVKLAITASERLQKVLAKNGYDLEKSLADPDAAKALADGSVDKASAAMAALQGTACQGA